MSDFYKVLFHEVETGPFTFSALCEFEENGALLADTPVRGIMDLEWSTWSDVKKSASVRAKIRSAENAQTISQVLEDQRKMTAYSGPRLALQILFVASIVLTVIGWIGAASSDPDGRMITQWYVLAVVGTASLPGILIIYLIANAVLDIADSSLRPNK